MRIGAVDTIAADHDARNAASRPTCRCLMDAAGQDPGLAAPVTR
jgi:hypothetical protein